MRGEREALGPACRLDPHDCLHRDRTRNTRLLHHHADELHRRLRIGGTWACSTHWLQRLDLVRAGRIGRDRGICDGTVHGRSPWVGLILALAFTGLVATVLGATTLRLGGHFLPLSTIAWGIAIFF